MADEEEDDFPWSIGVFDAHCHPTDTMSRVPDISNMKAKSLVIMATRKQDQNLVSDVAKEHGIPSSKENFADHDWRGVIPSFGWHPWFSHQIYDDSERNGLMKSASDSLDVEAKIAHYKSVLVPESDDRGFLTALPDPIPLSQLLSQIKQKLEEFPTALIGEIGLDKAFRIPESWLPGQADDRDESLTPGGREGRRLSPYRVSMDHQRKILLAQLRLAGEMQRAVSVHGVQAHGVVFETLETSWKGHEKTVSNRKERKQRVNDRSQSTDEAEHNSSDKSTTSRPFPPRICLHSYSGPPDTLKQYLNPSVPAEIFFSFSTAINFSTSARSKTEAVIKALPADRILVESDLHTAGEIMDEHLRDIVIKVCELKGWELADGMRQLARNWKRFVLETAREAHSYSMV